MKNPTRTYLNKVHAMFKAFTPVYRFKKANLNKAWRVAPLDMKPTLLEWMLRGYGQWRPMEEVKIDKNSLS